MDSPQSPTLEHYPQLDHAGELAVRNADGEAVLKFKLPRQAVSLLQLTQ